jgi:hypothetical protein
VQFNINNKELLPPTPFSWEIPLEFSFMVIVYLWLGWCTCFNEKTTLDLESGFSFVILT